LQQRLGTKRKSPNLQRVLKYSFVGVNGRNISEGTTELKDVGSAWATEIRGHCHPPTRAIGFSGSKVSYTSVRNRNIYLPFNHS
jgi:hypothetical protein